MADKDDSSSHTRSRKAHLEPVVFLKLRNRWADINPPQLCRFGLYLILSVSYGPNQGFELAVPGLLGSLTLLS